MSQIGLLFALITMTSSLQSVQLHQMTQKSSNYSILKGQFIFTQSNEIQISNYQNLQYYTTLALGSPPQQFSVILDTGSHKLWVTGQNCIFCQNKKKFKQKQSTTFNSTRTRDYIIYGKGQVYGDLVSDILHFQNISLDYNFLLVDKQKDNEQMVVDGLLGLSNYMLVPTIFDVAYEKKLISSPLFAFKFGFSQIEQKSYFYYNISNDDFNEAVYCKTTRNDYWSIQVQELKINQKQYSVGQALIDSGTSLIVVNETLYYILQKEIFQNNCDSQKTGILRVCNCPQYSNYPNISIKFSEMSLNITPNMYLYFLNQKCYLGIQKLANLPFIILGDTFMREYIIVFDTLNQKIGFIGNYHVLQKFFQSNLLLNLLDACFYLGILLGVGLVLSTNKRSITINSSVTKPQSVELGNQDNNPYRF